MVVGLADTSTATMSVAPMLVGRLMTCDVPDAVSGVVAGDPVTATVPGGGPPLM
jgi:hypothetical protein